jgi:hypothetical protein
MILLEKGSEDILIKGRDFLDSLVEIETISRVGDLGDLKCLQGLQSRNELIIEDSSIGALCIIYSKSLVGSGISFQKLNEKFDGLVARNKEHYPDSYEIDVKKGGTEGFWQK